MKIKRIALLFIFASTICYAQNGSAVLFQIDGTPVTVSEFKRVYEKNIELVVDDSQKELKNYLELYINYKLKLKQAYQLKLDTVAAYKRDVRSYRDQLAAPYLQDTVYLNSLVRDAYFRTKHEIRARHILVGLSPKASPKDTLIAYQKIINARKEIIEGKPFSEVAKKFSDDRSVKSNGGDLGYFSAFRMVYSFENMAYNTKKGTVSMPFKTRFGYHIVKVIDVKESEGEIEVAHILVLNKTAKGKNTIDSIYTRLNEGEQFSLLAKKHSEDVGTAKKGGRLTKFGRGTMEKAFENVAFSLAKKNELSKPFRTRFGWHIVKLLQIHPVKSFAELKPQLTSRIKSSGRAKLSDIAVLKRLKSNYKIRVNEQHKTVFFNSKATALSADSLQQVLFTINAKKIMQFQFLAYIKSRRRTSMALLFEQFLNKEVRDYFKENLIFTEPAYAATLKEYQDGVLLFEIMQQRVWNKSMTDSLGLQNFFVENKIKYTFKDLTKNRGAVMNDYQNHLEQEWLKELKEKYTVKIKKRTLKRLFNSYRK